MSQLDTKKVTSMSCGPDFVLALGQTLKAGTVGTQSSLPMITSSVIDETEKDRSRGTSADRDKIPNPKSKSAERLSS
jgi:hypothetical protein